MSSIKVGDVFRTNQGCSVIVLERKNLKSITIQFIDKESHIAVVQASALYNGNIKNPYFPSVRGVGYMGVGSFFSSKDRLVTPEYKAWLRMMSRCYGDSAATGNASYEDCTVHEKWHNFQNFAEWYTNHEYYGMGYHLDKDILVRGNRIYSEDSCSLVPVALNSLVLDRASERGDYPIGVSLVKRRGKFSSKLRVDGVTKNLGNYDTAEDAHKAYLREKTANIKRMALQYKDAISEDVFNALTNWIIVT